MSMLLSSNSILPIVSTPAVLALETGDIFYGRSIGVHTTDSGYAIGEVVFNTAITGYQEILTDPSYAGQIITLTYPHIGNTGIMDEDNESNKVFANGLIVKDCTSQASNWRSQQNLNDFLIQKNVVGISDIDTRALTQILREKGALSGVIIAPESGDDIHQDLINQAITKAKYFVGLANLDLAKVVSTKEKYTFNQGSYQLNTKAFTTTKASYKVAVYDFGVKKNILRMLVDAGCSLTVYPAQTSVEDILMDAPDGVFLSNGPGDPRPCDYAINNIKILLKKNIPIFGICLGHQLLALAAGAKTQKMKFGHHGSNHPVQDLATKAVMITSQNHSFSVSKDQFSTQLSITHKSLFDQSIQGIKVIGKPAFSFQGHPEASPGPHDVSPLFAQFIQLM